MARFDFTTLGEGVIRLSVPPGTRIEEAVRFDVTAGGAEANVAAALVQLGWKCGWASALPSTPTGLRVLNEFRRRGIDCSSVLMRSKGRVGCCFIEFAHPPRSTRVVFDRRESCFAQMTSDEMDWEYLLDTGHLHVSGLTVPLSPFSENIVASALEKARERSLSTSLDINYRHLLWPESEARTRLLPLTEGTDILFCSLRDARKVFECVGEPELVARRLAEQAGVANCVITLGDRGALAWDGATLWHEKAWQVPVIDRIGAGDALAAGVIFGWKQGSLKQGLRYGNLMAALALTQCGDVVSTSLEELDRLLAGPVEDIVR